MTVMKPNEEFICDHCHCVLSPKEGHIVFRSDSNEGGYDEFKIVHKWKCDKSYSEWSWEELEKCIPLTPANFAYVLSWIHPGAPFVTEERIFSWREVYGWVELTKRLYVPYYEEARKFMSTFSRLCHETWQNEVTALSEAFLKRVITEGGQHD